MLSAGGIPAEVIDKLGCTVFERGWLSSNNILFGAGSSDSTLVDSGYATHSDQTVALVRAHLHGLPLGRVVNTHLHSDHCGGNAALQAEWGSTVTVPDASFDAAASWDEERLTFKSTGQACERFVAHESLSPGQELSLGGRPWRVIGVQGHDPDAVMLFEQGTRTLISGDALWEDRLAIVFPACR
jgi:glyoxylase-like metal-dependent hydrolase (beta-lactamase superfamily II)